METLQFAINAVFPILLLIILGYFLKKKHFLEEPWFKKGNTFIFRICLPVMLFVNVYNLESFDKIEWTAVYYAMIATVVLFALGVIFVKCTVPDDRQKGVILQAVFRSNYAIIGLPLTEALGGAEAVSMATVLSACCIPLYNILAVLALTMFQNENGQKADIKDTLKKIATNPLICAVAAGFVVLGIRSLIPVNEEGLPVFTVKNNLPFLFTAINNLAKICSPLALIILGGLFEFSAIKSKKRAIIIGTIVRVVVVPLVAISALILLDWYGNMQIDKVAYPPLLALFGAPTAVSGAIMAQEMDCDGELAGQLVVWTSIASIATLFVFIYALRALGLL